jgi:uncharacterized protein (TIGR02271 family)
MPHTVIGFFRNSVDAYHAADILKDRGFVEDRIDISTSDINESERNERSGKVGNFFKSLFSDDDNNASRYSEAARNNSLVTVHAYDIEEAERAADILDECGAVDIDENRTGTDYTKSDANYGSSIGNSEENLDYESSIGDTHSRSDYDSPINDTRFTSDKDRDLTNDRSIPIIEEEVNVGKQEVRRGGVRIHSRIIEKPVEETLRLREERVHVERTPVDRDASDAELENFHEETIEVTEYGEEPLVSKSARVVEEVRVGKEVHERQETIRETKRKTEVDVENLEDENIRKKKDYDK